MWTIIYQKDGKDKWDRLDSKDDIKDLLKALRNDPGVCFNDVWIFTPDADDHTIDPNDLLFDNDLLTMLSNCLKSQGYSFTESQLKELLGEEISARFEKANEIQMDELDFFMDLLDMGITLKDIKLYCPDRYKYSKEFMEGHGLI